MEFELRSPAKKYSALAVVVLMTASYVALSAAQMVAAYFSESLDPVWLKRAVSLDSGNAETRDQLGRYELLVHQSPQAALPWFESAVALDTHTGRYWTGLALAQQMLGRTDSAKRSLQRALQVEPHTPVIVWEAANLYVAQGAVSDALKEFHDVLQNDPELMSPAIRLCWNIRPDIDYLLDNIFPAQVRPQLLEFLIAAKETKAAEQVWQQMFAGQQSLERQDLFEYTRYLILQNEPVEAARVWQQAAGMAALEAYEPSSANLIVNGDFGLEILNGGFDWVHHKNDGVTLELDPSETHSSSRSLRITFDGPGIIDAGISQVVAVEPNTTYEFSGFYKAQDMDGAGGMQFSVQDAYRDTSFFMSEDLRDAGFWKRTGGSFTTGPETQLLIVRIVRVPSGSPIRGRIWIDGIRLVPASEPAAEVAGDSPEKKAP